MDRLLSPLELSRILGFAEQTIYNRKAQGMPLPPYIRVGRFLRFRESEVKAWIDSLAEATPQPAPVVLAAQRRPGRPTKAEEIAKRNSSTNP